MQPASALTQASQSSLVSDSSEPKPELYDEMGQILASLAPLPKLAPGAEHKLVVLLKATQPGRISLEASVEYVASPGSLPQSVVWNRSVEVVPALELDCRLLLSAAQKVKSAVGVGEKAQML
eukprot:1851736-Pleurochrysis_carterae.AAC.1